MPLTTQQHGFTLVEILVTLVILSTGFLGLMSLQSIAIRQTIDLATHARANLHVNALAERIRANPDIAAHYTVSMQQSDCPAVPPACVDGINGGGQWCTGTEIASYDHWDLFCDRDIRHPSGVTLPGFSELNIDCMPQPCTATSHYNITLDWEHTATDTSSPQSRLLTTTLTVKPQ